MRKDYSQKKETVSLLNEPDAVLTDSLRVEMMREALKINDASLLIDALEYIKSLRLKSIEKYPCQYTVDEVRSLINQSLEEIKNGGGYTQEQIEEEMKTWID
jgi:hypothetical protein